MRQFGAHRGESAQRGALLTYLGNPAMPCAAIKTAQDGVPTDVSAACFPRTGLLLCGGGKLHLGAQPKLTFRDRTGRRARQWAQFLAANSVGGALNYGIYALIVSQLGGASPALPVLAVAVGSICGLVVNFVLSRRLVFARGERV